MTIGNYAGIIRHFLGGGGGGEWEGSLIECLLYI